MSTRMTLAVVGFAGLGLAGAGLAGSAEALTPHNTTFVATGEVALIGGPTSFKCRLTLSGATNNTGGATITGGSFTGPNPCALTSLTGLPWAVSNIAHAGTISPMGWTPPVTCTTPPAVAFTVGNAGRWKFNHAAVGACFLDGDLKTTPPITPP